MRIAVGSANPVKVEAVRSYLTRRYLHVRVWGIDVASGVSAQPRSDEETWQGALNRAKQALQTASEASLAVGLEGGVADGPGGLFLCNWAAAVDRAGRTGIGGGVRILLPSAIACRVLKGELLGDVVGEVVRRPQIARQEGAIGILTSGGLTRQQAYEQAVAAAVAPLLQSELYK